MENMVIYWIVFAAYLAFLAVAGIRAKKKTHTLEDFMVAGRNIGPLLLGVSYGVTYFSAVLLIGGGENAYMWGLSTLYIAFGNVFVGIFCMFVLFGRRTKIMSDEFGVMTISQLLSKRYDSKAVQYLSSIVILIFETVYLVSIYLGLSILLEIIMPEVKNAFTIAVIIVGAISVFYLYVSGSHGAITTDVLESIIMILGVVGIAIIGLNAVGGLSGLEKTLIDIEASDPTLKEGALTSFPGAGGFGVVGFILVTSFGTWGMPQMISRYFTANKKSKTLKWGLLISISWALVISYLAYLNGVIGRAYFFSHPEDAAGVTPANVIPKMMITLLPLWLASLFIASVTAASLTTGEKVVLVAAGSFAVDFYQDLSKASDEKTMKVTRITTIFVVFFAVIIAIYKIDSVLALAMFAWAAIASTILVPYVFGLFWKRGTAAGALWGGLSAFIVTVVWWFCFRSAKLNASFETDIFPLLPELGATVLYTSEKLVITVGSIHEFIVSQVVALIVFIVVSLLTKPPSNEKLTRIFDLFDGKVKSE